MVHEDKAPSWEVGLWMLCVLPSRFFPVMALCATVNHEIFIFFPGLKQKSFCFCETINFLAASKPTLLTKLVERVHSSVQEMNPSAH